MSMYIKSKENEGVKTVACLIVDENIASLDVLRGNKFIFTSTRRSFGELVEEMLLRKPNDNFDMSFRVVVNNVFSQFVENR